MTDKQGQTGTNREMRGIPHLSLSCGAYNASMTRRLLTPSEVDRLLRYPRGRSARLARRRQLPAVTLPDGEIRFDADQIDKLISSSLKEQGEATNVPR
jgi:hypothetical protein